MQTSSISLFKSFLSIKHNKRCNLLLVSFSNNTYNSIFKNRFHVVVRLASKNRPQTTTKCGKNKGGPLSIRRVCYCNSHHILTSSVIYYWTWNPTVLYTVTKKQIVNDVFMRLSSDRSKSLSKCEKNSNYYIKNCTFAVCCQVLWLISTTESLSLNRCYAARDHTTCFL